MNIGLTHSTGFGYCASRPPSLFWVKEQGSRGSVGPTQLTRDIGYLHASTKSVIASVKYECCVPISGLLKIIMLMLAGSGFSCCSVVTLGLWFGIRDHVAQPSLERFDSQPGVYSSWVPIFPISAGSNNLFLVTFREPVCSWRDVYGPVNFLRDQVQPSCACSTGLCGEAADRPLANRQGSLLQLDPFVRRSLGQHMWVSTN